ncbi:tripartite tricarboxylate transporter TctB family protein [Halostagnicola kamekurae]|uniref:Tripartite tricarboxylate transporter TctB family protein n=1 Tax=Halostagnicola kamekurae TaxID=619731 RepID=A0A1I6UVE4_9EURY|nr:tripartite tricarboxylate transporter TctB family protein [Halostagnicola kamekurae]SFT05327.1 Tripartite tricarboxylate transporter TctB family protein [Halostagnicola kamekurae]
MDRLTNMARGEHVFAALLVTLAVYMFITAYDFPPAARLFPQAASGIVIVAATLRVVNHFIPYEFTKGDSVVLSGSGDDESSMSETEESGETENRTRMLVLGVLITGYILGGFAVGLFWVTPPFALAYLVYTGQKWWVTAIITAALTGVAYVFIVLMKLDLVTGGI